eukprot:CAMPEP_0180533960 /NCGR_PEP_ID=MMETSP1036_2-20121128/63893_1 /TAXON_ID=632150 /ORGANISM="Azadinium spinosum, Strain 3D9" /LENGTH=77 /DNA_ID=CAMNT_0022548187 /DNA_START=88 /DNA_END=321 /DNA_ORIENTATION=-
MRAKITNHTGYEIPGGDEICAHAAKTLYTNNSIDEPSQARGTLLSYSVEAARRFSDIDCYPMEQVTAESREAAKDTE